MWVWVDFCNRHTKLGFYNNWFVTNVDWWLTPRVQTMQRRFDESMLIFTRRFNDLGMCSPQTSRVSPRRGTPLQLDLVLGDRAHESAGVGLIYWIECT